MEDIINRIEKLKQRYPLYIKTYHAASDDKIHSSEHLLNVTLPKGLVSLFKYSDGIGFLDYALYGVSNKRMESIWNDINVENLLIGTRIEFISTCCGKSYLVNLDREKGEEITYMDRNSSTELIVARSLEEFFEKFLTKMEVLLAHFDPKNVVAYFEDDNMPQGLAKW